jgi:hypothetical protein
VPMLVVKMTNSDVPPKAVLTITAARVFAFLFVLLTIPPLAAQPSTQQDWQRMYDACVAGVGPVFQKKGIGPEFASRVCVCIRDGLQKTAASEMNTKYEGIQKGCIQSLLTGQALLSETDWSPEGIAASKSDCNNKPPIEVSASFKDAFCSCIAENTARSVRRREFLLLDAAIRTKGMGRLDPEETKILTKALEAINYCSIKILGR